MNFNANQLKMLRLLYLNRVNSNGLSGVDISKAAKVGIGSVYPFLTRLVNDGMATSKWEEISPQEEGRPRKRFYQLTGLGVSQTQLALADFQLVDTKIEGVPEPGGGIVYG